MSRLGLALSGSSFGGDSVSKVFYISMPSIGCVSLTGSEDFCSSEDPAPSMTLKGDLSREAEFEPFEFRLTDTSWLLSERRFGERLSTLDI